MAVTPNQLLGWGGERCASANPFPWLPGRRQSWEQIAPKPQTDGLFRVSSFLGYLLISSETSFFPPTPRPHFAH